MCPEGAVKCGDLDQLQGIPGAELEGIPGLLETAVMSGCGETLDYVCKQIPTDAFSDPQAMILAIQREGVDALGILLENERHCTQEVVEAAVEQYKEKDSLQMLRLLIQFDREHGA